MIADCETCDRKQVPCGRCETSQRVICFVCQGDECDPYGELPPTEARRCSCGKAANRSASAVALLREGLSGMAIDERMRWKVRVEAFLSVSPGPSEEPTHADLCILSRIFHERDFAIPLDASVRINEWLKAQIAASPPNRAA